MENRENLKNKIFDHMDKLRIPVFIQDEFLEQEVFYSTDYLKKMLTWTLYQFENWYDSHSDYCMSNY